MVYCGLAANRGIDLREQRGRHLDEGHAALIHRSGEPSEIADDTAAERDDRRLPIAAGRKQRVEHPVEGAPVLGLLAIWNHYLDRVDVRGGKRAAQALEIEGRHDGVGHYRGASRSQVGSVQRRIIQDA